MNIDTSRSRIAASAISAVLMSAAIFTGCVFPGSSSAAEADNEKNILYWVAPMDPNYRRDKPGSHRWAWI